MNRAMRPRSINLATCRPTSEFKPCSVNCGEPDEIIVVPLETLNQMLKDKTIDPIAVGDFATKHASEVQDLHQLKALFGEFGLRGKAYPKTIRGKPYMIFKGRAGLRRIFTGTKYGAGNSKVLSYGIGKAGLSRSIKVGGIFSLVFVNAWNVVEHFVDGQDKTLTDLGVNISSDSTKIVLSAVVGGFVGAVAVTMGAPIVVPLAAGFVVSVVVGELLDAADAKWQITESFRVWSHEVIKDLRPMYNNAKNYMQGTVQNTKNAVGGLARDADREFKEWTIWFDTFNFGFR